MRAVAWALLLAVCLQDQGLSQDRRQVAPTPRREQPAVKTQEAKPGRQDGAKRETRRTKEPRIPKARGRATELQQQTKPRQIEEHQALRPLREEHRRVFETVRTGLLSGEVRSFSEFMGPQVYVNLRGGESGYFSANQAYYLIEDYVRSRKISNLEYSTAGEADATPYASGNVGFQHKGNRETAQLYVSLSEVGGRWVISQIKIY